MKRSPSSRTFFLTLAFIWGVSCWAVPAADPDLGWQLLGGELLLTSGEVMRLDPINSFAAAMQWHNYHWLAQAVMYLIYDAGGFEFLRLCFGLLMGLLAVVVVDIALARSAGLRRNLPSAIFAAGALLLLWQVTSLRPQMLALLVLALALRRLLRSPRWWELPFLSALTVILVNMHVYWVFMPYLWLVYRCMPRFIRKRACGPIYAWGGFFFLSACGLISPFGILQSQPTLQSALDNYALIWDYLHTPNNLQGIIREMKSILAVSGAGRWILLAELLILARVVKPSRIKADLPNAINFVIGAALAIKMVKFAGVFALFGLPFVVRHGAPPLQRALKQWGSALTQRIPLLCRTGTFLLSLAAFAACLWLGISMVRYSPFEYAPPIREKLYPLEACAAVAKQDLHPKANRSHIRVLTHFDYGGWCRWQLHQTAPQTPFRVTTDNRTQGIPEKAYQASFDLFTMRGNWLNTLHRWSPDIAVLNKQYPLAHFMALATENWKKIYEDGQYAVFIPTSTMP